MDITEYKNRYKKEHYIRKEINFKPDEWLKLEKILKQTGKSLKILIIENIINKK